MGQNSRDSSRNSHTSPLAWAPDLCQAPPQSQTPWNTPWHPHWKRNRSKEKQTVFHSQFGGRETRGTGNQAAPGFGDLHLVEEEPDLHIPWPNHYPAHGSGYTWERKCLNSMPHNHFPIVWEWRDSQGRRYPVLLRLQCRTK